MRKNECDHWQWAPSAAASYQPTTQRTTFLKAEFAAGRGEKPKPSSMNALATRRLSRMERGWM